MKHTDNVFFFVLVDFFLQLIFLGVVLSVFGSAGKQADTTESDSVRLAQLDTLRARTGISDLTKLTDLLTTLVPAKNATGSATLAGLDTVIAIANTHGGPSRLDARLRTLEEDQHRVGITPCVDTVISGRLRSVALAHGVLTDSYFRLDGVTARLRGVFDSAGVKVEEGEPVPLERLQEAFGRLRPFPSACYYRID
ncbi:MAG: hypothetical protein ABIU97_03990, partial [Dehalococcoidia bacterium]